MKQWTNQASGRYIMPTRLRGHVYLYTTMHICYRLLTIKRHQNEIYVFKRNFGKISAQQEKVNGDLWYLKYWIIDFKSWSMISIENKTKGNLACLIRRKLTTHTTNSTNDVIVLTNSPFRMRQCSVGTFDRFRLFINKSLTANPFFKNSIWRLLDSLEIFQFSR